MMLGEIIVLHHLLDNSRRSAAVCVCVRESASAAASTSTEVCITGVYFFRRKFGSDSQHSKEQHVVGGRLLSFQLFFLFLFFFGPHLL